MNAPAHAARVGFARRLAAIVYDWLLLAALLLVFTAVTWLVRGGREIAPGTLWFQLALLGLVGAFFTGFWTLGGQTVGMAAWKFRVERCDGTPLGARDAARRAALTIVSLAPLALGFLWCLVDADARAWHDRLSNTRLVRVTKRL